MGMAGNGCGLEAMEWVLMVVVVSWDLAVVAVN